MDLSGNRDGLVMFQSSSGVEVRGTVVRLDRYTIVFEVYSPTLVLQMSEALADFTVLIKDRAVFSGRATVRNLIGTPTMTIVEAGVEEGWRDPELFEGDDWKARVTGSYREFFRELRSGFKIRPEFKVVLADMQMFLMDLRQWVEQVEMAVRAAPTGDRTRFEQEVAAELGGPINATLTPLFEKFEEAARTVEEPMIAAHTAFARRQLHPLLLCSPFLYRCFQKPLGYAGDYEMVNMILRPPYEGSSLYAKLVNHWFWCQAPAEAHRNRVVYLCTKLYEEAARASSQGKRVRVFNVGCGPAGEVQAFLKEHEVSNFVDFTMLDFNEETLQFGMPTLTAAKERNHRLTGLQFIKKSVHQILKETGKSVARAPDQLYDIVYCAGLFDYLPDAICKRLVGILYEYLAPGGLLITTNVDDSNPRRLTMEYVMDWHLIYRNGNQMANLRSERLPADTTRVTSDITGVNLYCETRKPQRV